MVAAPVSPSLEGVSAARAPLDEPRGRPLGFNCPSCGVVLTIPNPQAYDGRPAPCPGCAVLVLPPRIFHAGDEELEGVDLHPLPGLSGRPGERTRMPRVVHRVRRREEGGRLWTGGLAPGVVLSGRR
jgi:hypothetical protein